MKFAALKAQISLSIFGVVTPFGLVGRYSRFRRFKISVSGMIYERRYLPGGPRGSTTRKDHYRYQLRDR